MPFCYAFRKASAGVQRQVVSAHQPVSLMDCLCLRRVDVVRHRVWLNDLSASAHNGTYGPVYRIRVRFALTAPRAAPKGEDRFRASPIPNANRWASPKKSVRVSGVPYIP